MRALITGSRGFIGDYLYDYLERQGHQVVGDRHLWPHFEIREPEAVDGLLRYARPDWIFHLAAQSFPAVSFREPQLTLETNVTGTANLLEAVRKVAPAARALLVSSSAVYGGGKWTLSENHRLNPQSPYAVSKAAAEMLCRQYSLSYGLDVVIVRLFGTTGPGKEGDAISDFARRIANREAPVRVGNLNTVRDISDVRDVVGALTLVIEKGHCGETYNVCQGRGYSVRELLGKLLSLSGDRLEVESDPSLLRPSDEPQIIGNTARTRALGWEPRITIDQTLKDTFEWWRERTVGHHAV